MYKKITLDLYNEEITLTPIESFLIRDPNMTDSKVIMYQIKYLNKRSQETSEAVIPYYISDGFTNHLRANMVYPFMSFNIRASHASPYSDIQVEGLLFKYNIGKNINVKSIEHWVRYNFVKIYNESGIDGNSILRSLDAESNENREGVTSVLGRLSNLLDYFISIISSDISSYNIRDIRCYRPIYDKDQMHNKYNINYCEPLTPKNEKDLYKSFILQALKDQIDHLLNCQLFVVDNIMLVQTQITRNIFNERLSICTNQLYHQNVANYVNISIIFHRNVKAYVTQLLQTPIPIVQQALPGIVVNSSFIHFMTRFNDLLNDTTELYSPSAEALYVNILHWKARCRQGGGGKNNSIPIKQIENVNTTIKNLIKYNDIRAVNGHTTTELMLKKLYGEYKIKYLNLKKLL